MSSNLPPGCRVSDIPGNRPEDEYWEAVIDNFFNKERLLSKERTGIPINENEYQQMSELYDHSRYSDIIDTYITHAIEYGMDIGTTEATETILENNTFYWMGAPLEELIRYINELRPELIDHIKNNG